MRVAGVDACDFSLSPFAPRKELLPTESFRGAKGDTVSTTVRVTRETSNLNHAQVYSI